MSHTGPQYQTNPNKLLLNAKGLIMCWNFIFNGLKSVWKLTTQTKALCLQMIFSAARIIQCFSNIITCWGNSWQKVCVRTILTVFRSHKNQDQFTGYLLVFEQGNMAKVINASASVKTVFLHLGKSLLMQLGVILIINYLGECTVVFNITHRITSPHPQIYPVRLLLSSVVAATTQIETKIMTGPICNCQADCLQTRVQQQRKG